MVEGKEQRVQEIVADLANVVVAFSGGADSALLLKISLDTLGPEHVLAAIGRSGSLPKSELDGALAFARTHGAPVRIVDTEEMADPNYAANPVDRCYFCKTELFDRLRSVADEVGFQHIVTGAIADDDGDWRPGLKAGRERGVRAPLAEAGLTKVDVRAISRRMGLETWDKPAMACLASRFPYGEAITEEKLKTVEQAETILREMGFRQYRVRHHGDLARIELGTDEIARALADDVRTALFDRIKALGYTYVSLDLEGYRSGSMNEVI